MNWWHLVWYFGSALLSVLIALSILLETKHKWYPALKARRNQGNVWWNSPERDWSKEELPHDVFGMEGGTLARPAPQVLAAAEVDRQINRQHQLALYFDSDPLIAPVPPGRKAAEDNGEPALFTVSWEALVAAGLLTGVGHDIDAEWESWNLVPA